MDLALPDLVPPKLKWGRKLYKHPGTFLGSGNRCGHDPRALAVDRLDLHLPRGGHWPKLIQVGIKRIQHYFDNATLLPPLAHLSKKRNKDGSLRQNRSEAREGHALVTSVIFTYLDLKSLRVGYYTTTNAFVSIPFLEIAQRCGMTCFIKDRDNEGQLKEVPTSRFWRIIRDLKKAGVITVFEQYEEKDAGKRALTAIKTVSEKFLRLVTGWTAKRIENARKRANARVGDFLIKASNAGVENVNQRKRLVKEIQSANVKREMFGAPKAKNLQPATGGSREAVESALNEAYAQHEADVLASITAELGRPPRGMEQLKMQARHGLLKRDDFIRRRLAGDG